MLARQAGAADLEIRVFGLESAGYPIEITVDNRLEFGPGYLDPSFLPWAPSARPREDGERLFGWLLADERLKTAWAEARGQYPERRVRLRIDEDAPELHAIPWELLRDAAEGLPPQDLAAMAATPFSRYLAGRWQPGTPILRCPIKILVAIANPLDLADYRLAALDPEAEWALLQEAAGGLDVELIRLSEPCTLPALEEALWKGTHILHLIAHGVYRKEAGGAVLYLADGENRVSPVRAPEFAAMLARQLAGRDVEQGDDLRLVFLASCQTAACSPADALRSLAPALVAAGVPAVVAMQDLVPVGTAQEFARIFYRQLLRHGVVDLACNQARSRLLTAELPGASIPVLFLRVQDGRLFEVVEVEEAVPEVPPPPIPIQPPLTTGFVGRETELASYAGELDTRHLAVICGMAGVGKTALAAVLAGQVGGAGKTFWHTFHEGEGVEELIWRLAGFLYWQGQGDLWQMLQGVRQGGGQPPPPAILFDYLFQELRGRRFLLCLDDLDFVEEDACLASFLERLVPALQGGDVRLIVTSQRTPAFVQVSDVQVLAGLSLEDTGRFLARHGLPVVGVDKGLVYRTHELREAEKLMTPDVVATLHERTGGNPTFLILVVNALKRTSGPLALLARLSMVEEVEVERFLMREIDRRLTEDERRVMGALSVLLGYSGTRDAVEAVLGGQNVRRTLRDLSERHLLNVREDEKGRNYKLNALVRYFYYDSLSSHPRREMHRRAGAYYEAEEPDLLKAALHYERAGEAERAARLATDDVWALINLGQARPLQYLLGRLAEQSLDACVQLRVCEVRGDLQYLLGELDGAVLWYKKAGEFSMEPLAQARLHRKVGDVLARKGEYECALEQVSRGRELLAGAGPVAVEGARLAVVYGTILLALGRYDEAEAAARSALDGLGKSGSHAQATADLHDVLGKVYYYKGQLAQGLEQFRAALEWRQSASDPQGIMKSYSNLAVVYGQQNRYAEALQANEAALEVAERIGDVRALAALYTNMAADAIEQGAYDQAQEFNERSLALKEKMGSTRGLRVTHQNLGEIYWRMERFDLAEEHLAQAISLARRLGDQIGVVSGTQRLAEVYLAQGRMEEALRCCQEALQLSQEIGDRIWRPSALRLLGCIHRRQRRWEEARSAFAEANQIWREHGAALDLANGLVEWARMEHEAGQISQARVLCAEAVALSDQVDVGDLLQEATVPVFDQKSEDSLGEETK